MEQTNVPIRDVSSETGGWTSKTSSLLSPSGSLQMPYDLQRAHRPNIFASPQTEQEKLPKTINDVNVWFNNAASQHSWRNCHQV